VPPKGRTFEVDIMDGGDGTVTFLYRDQADPTDDGHAVVIHMASGIPYYLEDDGSYTPIPMSRAMARKINRGVQPYSVDELVRYFGAYVLFRLSRRNPRRARA
jgi:hypothetical protein